jgi:hypothetical protein
MLSFTHIDDKRSLSILQNDGDLPLLRFPVPETQHQRKTGFWLAVASDKLSNGYRVED